MINKLTCQRHPSFFMSLNHPFDYAFGEEQTLDARIGIISSMWKAVTT